MPEESFRCRQCGANRFVSVSLNGGVTRVPQCVPCGAIHPDYYGHGWQSASHDSGWTKRDTPPAKHRTFHCDQCGEPAMNIDANGLCRSCRPSDTPPANGHTPGGAA